MTRYLKVLSVAFLSLAGCAKEEIVIGGGDTAVEGKPVDVLLSLSVDISGSSGVSGAWTRASGDDITAPGTEKESAVKSLTVFVVDVDGNEQEAKTASYSTIPCGWDGSGKYIFKHELTVTSGNKRIYIGANLTSSQIVSFAGMTGYGVNATYTARSGTDFDDYNKMMSEFTGDGGFTMFGKATSGEKELFEIPEWQDGRLELAVNVKLTRVVAKVLVAVETRENRGTEYGDEPDVEYVRLDSGDGQEWEESWIRRDDMYFTLNVTNRKLFMYPKTSLDSGRTVDPNYDFNSLVEFNKKDGVFDYRSDDASRNFVRWVPHVWNTGEPWGMMVEKYDEDRMPSLDGSTSDTPGVYNTGLYCLENTVGEIPDVWKSELADNERALTFMATTYVLIAARITPRHIVTGLDESGNETVYAAESEEDAKNHLPANKEGDDQHPAGTFYSPDNRTFYSYPAMKACIERDAGLPEDDPDKLTREKFLCYPEGWGYYFSYVDGELDNTGKSLEFSSERSSVFRNHYYILHVRTVGLPAFPGEGGVNSMDVDVRRYGWTDAGTGDITLKP